MTRKSNTDKDFLGTPAGAPAPARRKTTAKPRTKRSATLMEEASVAAEPVQAAAVPEATSTAEPSPEEIARLAYLYWEERGCQGGSPEEDWVRAEQALRQRHAATASV